MELVTSYYELDLNQSDVDFVDVNMLGDSKLFINPILLSKSNDKNISNIGQKKLKLFRKGIQFVRS